ncbi:endo-beta-N-acetylglucosaminidase [Clostridium sp. B9]|uniref:endo-beta-N-acetylglucosaminidase n=1 Tax=Clostridium sp. B9 TaxID=3423224 RepID=UPI003D2F02CD
MRRMRERIAIIAATVCVVTSSLAMTTKAGVSLPPTGEAAKGANQPFQHGYRSIDIENWNPEEDPYAEMLRAHIPLQERIEPFADTQANPNLSPETSLTNLNGDYGNYFFDSTAYTNDFSQYAYNFWQYTDYYGGWHGMAVDGVPIKLYAGGEDTNFEFGILNLPNPAYTNAAHKNGTKSIGCLFIPRTGQPYDALLKQDENGEYVVAKKLIEIKEYFGFDGYFINQETSISPDHIVPYKEFTKTLVDAGVYTQWYDCVDDVNGKLTYKPSLLPSHSSFVQDQNLGRVNDSIFMNYNWNSPDGWNNGDSTDPRYIDASVAEAKRIGINPLDSVLMGVEVAMGKFDGSHNSTRNMDVILDENGNPKTGIALFTPDYVKSGLDSDLGDPNQNRRGEADYQWMVAERERMFYTGVTIDPLDSGEKKGYSRPDVGVKDASEWGGVSRYITERSVIDGTTFTTNFNTGHGVHYYMDGAISNEEEWANMNIQDILPTWQWWIDTEGTKLQPDFDYGPNVEKGDKFTYEQVGAYEGGSSLVVNGDLDADNYLRLFKTDLDVVKKSKATVTYNKVSGENAEEMSLGLIFKDSPDKVEYVKIPGSDKDSDGWVTKTVDLSQFAGREIAVMGLAFSPEEGEVSTGYQMNIGEIKITDSKNYTPEMPEDFEIEEYLNTNEVYVEWDLENYEDVKQYNLYAKGAKGEITYLGGNYDEVYYIKDLPVDTKEILLTAEGEDGSESKPARIKFSQDYKVQDLKVTETAEGLEINWNKPSKAVKEIEVEVSLINGDDENEVFSKELKGNATSIKVPLNKGEGIKYKVEVSTDSKNDREDSVVARGVTKDFYAEPYSGSYKVVNGKFVFETPKNKDWWKMYITVDGTEYSYLRGKDGFDNIVAPQEASEISVILMDYEGNLSEKTILQYNPK